MLSWCWCCRPATLRNCSRHSVFGSSVVGLSAACLPVTVCLLKSAGFRLVLQSSFCQICSWCWWCCCRLADWLPHPQSPGLANPFFFLCICIYFTLFPIFFSSPSSASLGTGVSGCGSFYEYEWLSTRLLSHQLRWLVAFQFLVVAFCSFTCRFLLASGNPSSLLHKRRSYWSFYFQRCWVLFLIYIYIYIAFFSLNYWVLDLVCGSPFVWGFWFKLSSMTERIFLTFLFICNT